MNFLNDRLYSLFLWLGLRLTRVAGKQARSRICEKLHTNPEMRYKEAQQRQLLTSNIASILHHFRINIEIDI